MRIHERLVAALGVLALATVNAPQAAAQVTVSAAGLAVQPHSTVLVEGVRERVGGVWVGGMIDIDFGRVTLSASGLRGNLDPIDNTPAFDRDGGEISALIRLSPVQWFGLEGGYTIRAFNSAAGYQRWNIPSAGAVIFGTLGHPALRAHLRAAYLPSVSVSGPDSPDLGLATEAALTAEPTGVPLTFTIHYRLERYDFPGGASARLEQFDRIGVSVGVRVLK